MPVRSNSISPASSQGGAVSNAASFRELFVYGRAQVNGLWVYTLLDDRTITIGDVFEGEMLVRGTQRFAVFTDGLRAVSLVPRPPPKPDGPINKEEEEPNDKRPDGEDRS